MIRRRLLAAVAFAMMTAASVSTNVQAAPTSHPTSQPTSRQLQEQCVAAAKAVNNAYLAKRDKLTVEGFDAELYWRGQVFHSELDLAQTADQKVEAAQSYRKYCEQAHAFVVQRAAWDALPIHACIASYYVADGKLALARIKRDTTRPAGSAASRPADEELKRTHLAAAKAVYDAYSARREVLTPELLDTEMLWRTWILSDELALAEEPSQRLNARRSYLKDCQRMEALIKGRLALDALPIETAITEYYVADAQAGPRFYESDGPATSQPTDARLRDRRLAAARTVYKAYLGRLGQGRPETLQFLLLWRMNILACQAEAASASADPLFTVVAAFDDYIKDVERLQTQIERGVNREFLQIHADIVRCHLLSARALKAWMGPS